MARSPKEQDSFFFWHSKKEKDQIVKTVLSVASKIENIQKYQAII